MTTGAPAATDATSGQRGNAWEVLRAFTRLGLTSFGGLLVIGPMPFWTN